MPRILDEHLTRAIYHDGRGGTYGRGWFDLPHPFDRRARALVDAGVSSPVLVVGSGFGFLIEALLDLDLDAYGAEPGSWFWDPANAVEWASQARHRTMRTVIEPGALPDARFDWVVDEDASPHHSDAELPGFHETLERLAANPPIHLVTPIVVGDSALNWKSIEEWEATAPTHTWISTRAIDEAAG